MWVADTEELKRIVRACRELSATREREIRQKQEDSKVARKKEFLDEYGWGTKAQNEKSWADKNARDLASELHGADLTMELTLKAYGEQMTGEPEKILAELDRPSDVSALTLRIGSEGYSSTESGTTGFRLVADREGMTLVTFGGSKDWLDLASTKLKKLIDDGRPWYFWTAKPWFQLIVAIVVSIGWAGLFGSFADNAAHGINWTYLAPSAATSLLIPFIWPRILPKFELLAPGHKSKGGRAIGVFGSVVVWIVGTVVIPIVIAVQPHS